MPAKRLPREKRRGCHLSVPLRDDELARVDAAAAEYGVPRATWARVMLLRALGEEEAA